WSVTLGKVPYTFRVLPFPGHVTPSHDKNGSSLQVCLPFIISACTPCVPISCWLFLSCPSDHWKHSKHLSSSERWKTVIPSWYTRSTPCPHLASIRLTILNACAKFI